MALAWLGLTLAWKKRLGKKFALSWPLRRGDGEAREEMGPCGDAGAGPREGPEARVARLGLARGVRAFRGPRRFASAEFWISS